MDEPLSNLDAKLRVQMRTEVSRIQQRLGTTTVYVTHDQTEAMTLGDRVAVMRAGELQQVGPPARALRAPGQPVRRRVHRLAGDELPAGRARGRHGRRCRSATSAARRAARRGSSDGRGPRRDRRDPARALRGRRRWSATSATAASRSRPRSTCSSRWAPSSTPTSRSRPRALDSSELEELAADAGAAEVPGAGEPGRSSPDSTPASKVERGPGGRALARHREAAPVRPAERRAARGLAPLPTQARAPHRTRAGRWAGRSGP